jgi:hypothetical protein
VEEERPGGVHTWRAPVVKHAEELEQHVERQDPLHHWPHQHGGNPNDFDPYGHASLVAATPGSSQGKWMSCALFIGKKFFGKLFV